MEAVYKRFAMVWLLTSLGAVAAIAALNMLVDPAGAYRGLHSRAFEPLRYLDLNCVTKAEMVRRGDWQVIILGSSRAETGLPATHPFLATNRTCNLSFAGTRFPELMAAFDYACQHNPLKHVILCVDSYMFSPGTRWIEDFPESRFNPEFRAFDYYCKQLLGRSSTDRTWDAIRRRFQGYKPIPQDRHGFHKHGLEAKTSQRELFSRVLRILGGGYRHQSLDPADLEMFRHMVRVCRDRRIDLQVAIMPVHALDLELLYAGGRWSQFERWEADLVEILAQEGVDGKFGVWDFTGYAGPPAEAVPPEGDHTTRMKYYFENSHCTPVLGGLMLDAMFEGATTFGIKLDQANIKAHLARVLEDRAAYARTNAADIAWVSRILSEGTAGGK
jgi:hypothetical protein